MIKVDEKKVLELLDIWAIQDLTDYIKGEVHVQGKPKGEIDSIKGFQSFVKTCMKTLYNEKCKGAWIKEGKLYALNGYVIVEMGDPEIPCEKLPADVEPLNISNILKPSEVEVKVNAAVVKIQIDMYKANVKGIRGAARKGTVDNKGIYLIEGVAFNINYLYSLSRIFDFEKSKITIGGPCSPLHITDEVNQGLVLPVRLAEED